MKKMIRIAMLLAACAGLYESAQAAAAKTKKAIKSATATQPAEYTLAAQVISKQSTVISENFTKTDCPQAIKSDADFKKLAELVKTDDKKQFVLGLILKDAQQKGAKLNNELRDKIVAQWLNTNENTAWNYLRLVYSLEKNETPDFLLGHAIEATAEYATAKAIQAYKYAQDTAQSIANSAQKAAKPLTILAASGAAIYGTIKAVPYLVKGSSKATSITIPTSVKKAALLTAVAGGLYRSFTNDNGYINRGLRAYTAALRSKIAQRPAIDYNNLK